MNSAQTIINLIFLFAAASLVMFSLRGWARSVTRVIRREPLIEWQPRWAVPWGLVDLFVLLLLLFLLETTLAAVLRAVFGAQVPEGAEAGLVTSRHMLLMNVGYAVFMLAATTYLMLLRGARLADLGLDLAQVRADILLGLKAFVMLGPVVYAIQAILVHWWPSKHPLFESMREDTDISMLIGAGIAAVIAAPIVEEFAFRVLFQGWLENLSAVVSRSLTISRGLTRFGQNQLIWEWFCLGPRRSEIRPSLPDRAQLPASPVSDNPYMPPVVVEQFRFTEPSAVEELPPVIDPAQESIRSPASWRYLTILISSVVFALLHLSHGPDWVPLIVLALGLGYLYQRTHRILPSIMLHFSINAVSYLLFLVEILRPKN